MRKHPKHRNHTNPNYHIQPLSPDRVEKLLYGETLPNKHAQQRLAEARGTLIMPSLQDALQTAIQKQTSSVLQQTINEWAQDESPQTQTKPEEKTMPYTHTNFEKQSDGKVRFKETNGVSRAVFDYVNTHSGKTRLEVREALLKMGYKKGSVDSLISQNVRSGIFLQDPNDKLYSLKTSYQSVPSTKAQRKLPKRPIVKKAAPKSAPKVKTSAGIAALAPATTTPALNTQLNTQFNPKELLNTLSVMQARALYDELKKIFGG
jgi:hypothetical protein